MSRHPLLRDPMWVSPLTTGNAYDEHILVCERLYDDGRSPWDPCHGRCVCDASDEEDQITRPTDPLVCNAACGYAQAQFERKTIEQIAVELARVPGETTLATITRLERIPLPTLPDYRWDGLRQSVKRGLTRLRREYDGRVAAIGRVDFDLALAEGGVLVVRPHIHLVVVGPKKEHVRETLRPTPVTWVEGTRPIMVKSVSDQGALRYALKSMLQGVPKGEAAGPYRHSRERPPVAAQLAFDRFLMRHDIKDLLLMVGLRRYGDQVRLSGDPDR